MLIPLDQAPDLRYAEDIEVTVRLHPLGSKPRVTMDLQAMDEMGPNEPGLNIHGDRVFEMLVHALYFHFKNERETNDTCCLEHYAEEIGELLERIDEDDAGQRLLDRRMGH